METWEKRANQRERARLLGYLRRNKPIFKITGTWTGYRSGQERECHIEYTPDRKRADKIKAMYSILYTDGTSLILMVKEIHSKENIGKSKNGYGEVINQCLREGVTSVAELSH